MTDMTRAEIFRMGIVTQQLGIRNQQELIDLVGAGMRAHARGLLVKRRVNEVLDAYLDLNFGASE